ADAASPHVRQADLAVSLGSGPVSETYLSMARLIEAGRAARADAVHPGYGFLSESAAFARAVAAAGLVWVGPPPSAMDEMGGKLRARARMEAAGVPVVPGSRPGMDDEALRAEAGRLGFPVLIKASAGGGGKGMSRVNGPEELAGALAEGRRLAEAAFGDGTVYLERLLEGCRHVEFQVFGDRAGHVVHLFERECSVQRRHQKIVEETPSPALSSALREAMGAAAVAAARAVGYVGAGTVEFLVAADGSFYFLEMNTRLQVEHAITEETLGCDLVRTQLEVASGADLPEQWRAGRLLPRGHAIELRLYAEDPVGFLPRAGRILVYREPSGPGVRVDSGVEEGSVVGVEYDPLLAKLIVFAESRPAALARARRAVAEWVVLGVETNLPALGAVLAAPEFISGRYATDLVSRLPARAPASDAPAAAWIAAALAAGAPAPAGGAAPISGAGGDPWETLAGWRAEP
ncbi:MAG TPA: biotin carboxylase N-terminal domain-containing protein, partial [Thermoanaerobaculia bacterium]|nr:biotin carboxylase N-terminal domain-containing protein [Thermoanaerobaculia bacterium]